MARTATVPITMGASGAATIALDDFIVTDARFPAGERLAPHTHDRAAFAVMLEGSFDLGIARRTLACEPDSAVAEPVLERHSNAIGKIGARVLVIQPDPQAVEDLGPCGRLFGEVRFARRSPVCGFAWSVVRELRAPDAATPLAVEGFVLTMLALATRRQLPDRSSRVKLPWLARTRDYLHASFLRPPPLRQLAREAGVHPDHLARAFRARFGLPVGAYIRRLRLEWAATRLGSPDVTIVEVALAAGFADQSHFTRAFKQQTGVTPAAYRRTLLAGGPTAE